MNSISIQSVSIQRSFLALSFLSLLLLCGVPAQAQRKGGGIKQAEAILGKPLTPTQKKAVKAANTKRQEEIKPIQDQYKATVAKALGLTISQYEAREAKLRKNKKGE